MNGKLKMITARRNAHRTAHHTAPHAGGFSLIELLIVIVIIALVIGIVIPSVSAARKASKKTATQSFCTNISQAMSQFKMDNRRSPGRFSLRDMGGAANATAGMSAMENVMLDLAGGEVDASVTTGRLVMVGPDTSAARQVKVDLDKVGKPEGGKAYLTPSATNFVAQNNISQRATVAGNASANPTASFPDLVDAFGQPILIWMEDEAGADQIKFDAGTAGPHNFCRVDSSAKAARFYYNSNQCFLSSQSLGRNLINQTDPDKGSILAPPTLNATAPTQAQVDNLTALLGNPSYPEPSTMSAAASARAILPADGRGDYIIHSAGADNVYAGRRDRGAAQGEVVGSDSKIYYGLNFKTLAGVGYSDNSGKSTSNDITSTFDDILLSGGG
jgi:prepilin-type N-terminal cleavage/methylation domain-containing protein